MKDYKVVENDVAMVAEPGRITVEEYFDEVWKRVVEKSSKIIKK